MKEFILKKVKKYQKEMLLSHWDIDVNFTGTEHERAAMQVYIDTSYLRATIHVYDNVLNDKKCDIEEYIVHELSHIVVQPLVELSSKMYSFEFIEPTLENAVGHIRKLVQKKQ